LEEKIKREEEKRIGERMEIRKNNVCGVLFKKKHAVTFFIFIIITIK